MVIPILFTLKYPPGMKYLYKCVKILQSKITEKPLEKFGTRVATVNWM